MARSILRVLNEANNRGKSLSKINASLLCESPGYHPGFEAVNGTIRKLLQLENPFGTNSLLAGREIHHCPDIVIHQRLFLLTCLFPPRCVNSRHGFPVCEWFREIWSAAEIDKFQQWVLGK